MQDTDILIAGAGPAGLSAALAMAARGFHVTLVDPQRPGLTEDQRSTAILRPGRDLLEKVGAWAALAPHACPLKAMRIVETTGAQTCRDFEARDLGEPAFGWNIANIALRRALLEALDATPAITQLFGHSVAHFTARSSEARVSLTNGATWRARLVIACDGRNSALRGLAGIAAPRHDIGQKAIVFSATHPRAHEEVSSELHRTGGPFTLVPLHDLDGQPQSAIVWMDKGPEIARLAALDEQSFAAEASARCDYLLGPLRLSTKRQVWPIITQCAERFHDQRIVLAAEAAHVVPPIGAQGLNMSLADIAWLHEHLPENDPGAPEKLSQYSRERRRDIKMRQAGIDMLNLTSASPLAPVHKLRGAGIGLLHDIAPLRKTIMRLGLGG